MIEFKFSGFSLPAKRRALTCQVHDSCMSRGNSLLVTGSFLGRAIDLWATHSPEDWLNWRVLIATCKQLVWSSRIGRNMPIWVLYLILGSGKIQRETSRFRRSCHYTDIDAHCGWVYLCGYVCVGVHVIVHWIQMWLGASMLLTP
jgi:hypothetical protein